MPALSCLLKRDGRRIRDEERIDVAFLAISQRGVIVKAHHTPACPCQHRMACRRVPFHRASDAWIDVGFAGGDEAKLERTAGALAVFYRVFANIVVGRLIAMRL